MMKKHYALNIFLIVFALIFIYPLFWLVLSCFKSNEAIFTRPMALPEHLDWSAFINGWKGAGQYTYTTYYINTVKLVVPVVLFTVASAFFVAYGFARFRFKWKTPLFFIMISTLMLPSTVVLIPKYMLFNYLGWVNTYLPFIVPVMFGGTPFFIFMLMQFIRGIPRELDESATIDGCNSFAVLTKILLPNSGAALFSAGLFQFMWTWNDFFNPLVYINSVSKYPISLGLRMSLDMTTNIDWSQVMAMSLVSILPPTIIFFFCQRYFVEGIATSGIK